MPQLSSQIGIPFTSLRQILLSPSIPLFLLTEPQRLSLRRLPARAALPPATSLLLPRQLLRQTPVLVLSRFQTALLPALSTIFPAASTLSPLITLATIALRLAT